MFDDIRAGLKMLLHAWEIKRKGYPKHRGDAKQICKQVVENCWNGTYFQTSAGHFDHFWTRDFAFCAQALKRCGYKKRALQTITWALECFVHHDRVTTHITRSGTPIDFPRMAVDSLPLLIRSLRILNAKDLIKKHKTFLEIEAARYVDLVYDPVSCLVKKQHFSSIKDHSNRVSSTYDNSMLAMLKDDLTKLKLRNPLSKNDVKGAIKENFWEGKYFVEDAMRSFTITGDANTFPFWCGVFDKKMAKIAIASVRKEGLDKPFPLKYTKDVPSNLIEFYDWISGGYERNTIWVHLGLCYMDVVRSIDKKLFRSYVKRYKKEVERRKNFLELYTPKGKPFKSTFYVADHDMLWAVKLLDYLQS